jgi:hypothetical protein
LPELPGFISDVLALRDGGPTFDEESFLVLPYWLNASSIFEYSSGPATELTPTPLLVILICTERTIAVTILAGLLLGDAGTYIAMVYSQWKE